MGRGRGKKCCQNIASILDPILIVSDRSLFWSLFGFRFSVLCPFILAFFFLSLAISEPSTLISNMILSSSIRRANKTSRIEYRIQSSSIGYNLFGSFSFNFGLAQKSLSLSNSLPLFSLISISFTIDPQWNLERVCLYVCVRMSVCVSMWINHLQNDVPKWIFKRDCFNVLFLEREKNVMESFVKDLI